MTSREHYQRGMALLQEVEDMEQNLEGQMFEAEIAGILNANMMRILTKAKIHMMAASLKVTYDR